jgi:sugar O-acyltransferase (sialic acid O-acetyltransferase NeuD family)
MAKSNLIVIGTGGHATACIDVILRQGIYNIAGLIDTSNLPNKIFPSYPIIGSDQDLLSLYKKYQYVFIAIGQIKSSSIRFKLFEKVKKIGFKLPVIKSPLACISDYATIEEGTIIMNGVFINAGAKVGKNCIINTNALIEHDVIISDHTHISTGVIINGNVNVGSATFIGSGSIIKEGTSIGSKCVVGMGSNLRKNLKNNSVFPQII